MFLINDGRGVLLWLLKNSLALNTLFAWISKRLPCSWLVPVGVTSLILLAPFPESSPVVPVVTLNSPVFASAPGAGNSCTVVSDTTFPYVGYLDEIALYTHTLGSTRVEEHHNAGRVQDFGVAGYQPFPKPKLARV